MKVTTLIFEVISSGAVAVQLGSILIFTLVDWLYLGAAAKKSKHILKRGRAHGEFRTVLHYLIGITITTNQLIGFTYQARVILSRICHHPLEISELLLHFL